MRYFILHFISCCIDEDQLNAREWLLYGRSPIDLLRLKWDACYVLRRSDIDNAKDLVEILHLYPIFKDPKAAFLIELDFEKMFPGTTSNFYTWFPMLHQKLNNLIKSAVSKDKAYQPLYEAYQKATDGQRKDYYLCMLLPVIIQTNYRVKGSWKPSVKETQDSFILEVQTPGDIEVKIEQRLKSLKEKFGETSLQSQIVAVGTDESLRAALVIFGGAEYAAENIVHAVCMCMHITYVLNLQYAPDCKPLWLFIQSYLFKIPASIVELPKSTRDMLKAIDN
ncbi:uncharacterized protein LOC115267960 [Aedes albopictus]|uniref:Uncharacterized protein n=1 Tax=Aedes albopictus TaxID=7160 RepID=A0ABM1XXU2_AEDAL